MVNLVDVEDAKYAGEAGLMDILTLQKMCQENSMVDLSVKAMQELD